MTKVSFLKRIVPVVVVASLASVALLAGCSCSPTDDTAKDEVVTEEDAVVVVPDDTAAISKDEAKAIALEDAGFMESEVKDLQVTENSVDGAKAYEVVFSVDDAKYEYVIDAATGDILEFVGAAGSSSGSAGNSGNAGSGSSGSSSGNSSSGSNGSSGGSGSTSGSAS